MARLDRDDPFYDYIPANPVVDERTKAAGMRAAAASIPAAQKAIAKTPDELLLDRVNAQIADLTKKVADAEANAPLDLNKPVNKMTPAELKAYQKARVDAQAAAREDVQSGNNPDNPKPTEDPGPGMYWANFGGVWRKYKSPTSDNVNNNSSNNNNSGNNNNAGNNNNTSSTTDKTLVSTTVDDATGDTIGYFSDGSKIVLNKGTGPVQSAEFKDAYALLNQTFRDYGLESLVPAIEGFMKRNLGPNQAAVELRSMPEYIKRFKGNDLRRASGKNALTEAEYLAVEDAYDQTLRAYGQQNYFGIDRKTKQEKSAELIGNDISAVEFRDRIQLAVDRVQNADPTIKNTLKQFYPGLNESDLIGYFLNPTDNLPKLKEKVTASEIGAAAAGFNLGTDVTAATDLAKYGVTQAQAREGYSTIAGVLPTATKLGDIYNETGVKYGQAEGEAEVFKGSQDAATKRKRLASMERAAFSGSSGTGQSSLTRSTQGLL
jgi:hypothetical protein